MKTLKNMKQITTIYETYDYSLFNLIGGNRLINVLNYKKLMKSIDEKQLLIPILVNEKMEIIDGQHCKCQYIFV